MNKKLLAVLLGVLLAPLAGLAAQSSDSFRIISFDIGVAPAWGLNSTGGGYETLSSFALNVKVADALSVGFGTYVQGAATNTIETFTVKYEVFQKTKAMVGFGFVTGSPLGFTPANAVTGLGIEYAPFSRKNGDLFTDFKLGIQYLFQPQNGFEKGAILFGLSVGVGI